MDRAQAQGPLRAGDGPRLACRVGMGGRTAVGAGIALWGGLLLSGRLGVSQHAGAIALIALLGSIAVPVAGVALAPRGRRTRILRVLPTLALLVAFVLAGAARGLAHLERLAVERAFLRITDTFWIEGVIVEPAALESGAPLVVASIRAARPALATGAHVRLRLPEGSAAEWGDSLRALIRITPPDPPRNPGGSDAQAFADATGLIGSGVAGFAVVHRARGWAAWPRATAMRWRRAIERVLHASLSPAAAELVVPLVFGDRSAIDTDLDAAFRAAGLTHLLALSGLHVVWLG